MLTTRTGVRGLAFAVFMASRLLHASEPTIHVERPFAYATPPAAPTAAAFLTLTNAGPVADRLVGAASPAAGRIEIHTMSMHDGVMRMRPVDGVDLPAGATVALAPGGLHLMLFELAGPLAAGGHFDLTLRFEHAGAIRVSVPVVARGAVAPAAQPMEGHDHDMH